MKEKILGLIYMILIYLIFGLRGILELVIALCIVTFILYIVGFLLTKLDEF